MYEELIKWLSSKSAEADKKAHEAYINGYEVESNGYSGQSKAFSKAMKYVESLEPKELDQPDGEGWWILKDYGAYKPMYIEVFRFNKALYVNLFCMSVSIEEIKGKWIKAIEVTK